MIFDTLHRADIYAALHPGFNSAFAYLREANLETLTPGRHEIDGDRLFVIVGRDQGKGRDARLEAHRRYIDIQYVISGHEEMGWLPIDQCGLVLEAHNNERDFALFGDPPVSWFTVPPGSFTVFFPHDAHAPLAGTGTIRKAVVKVAVSWPQKLQAVGEQINRRT